MKSLFRYARERTQFVKRVLSVGDRGEYPVELQTDYDESLAAAIELPLDSLVPSTCNDGAPL